MTEQPFHVVRLAHNDKFQTYAIYANNEPFLVPPRESVVRGVVLGKREAYTITRLLNTGTASFCTPR